MTWALGGADPDLALNMAHTGWWYLLTYGFTQEGVRWLNQVLELTAGQQTPLRARVLVGAGRLSHQLGDEVAARRALDEAVAVGKSAQDLDLLDLALGGLVFVAAAQGDIDLAVTLAEENLAVAEQLGDPARIAHAHVRLGEHLVLRGDLKRGIDEAELTVRLTTSLGDPSLAAAVDTLGLAKRLSGAPATAAELLELAVKLHRDFGFKANVSDALFRWADALLDLGDIEVAATRCVEGLQLALESGSRRRLARGLRTAAATYNRARLYERGLHLALAAANLYADLGGELIPVDRADLEAVLLEAENALGVTRSTEIRASAARETLDSVTSQALGLVKTLQLQEAL